MTAPKLMRAASCLLMLFFGVCIESTSGQTAYQSPYQIVLTVPLAQLCAADHQRPRDNRKLESITPYEEWYSHGTRKRYGAWGPMPRRYPAIDGFETIPASWKRQRVLAVAHNMIGLAYQHHHVPDWEPPAGWPWKPVAFGRNSKGLDCSNFTSWVYNYGLGIHLSSDTQKQAATRQVQGPSGEDFVEVKVIRDDNGFNDLITRLKAGDLLYIKRKGTGNVSHVIIWVGEFGRSPDGTPLVIDCTGPEHQDCKGHNIPIGVQLRPFKRDSWYYQSFSHAHRIIGERLQSLSNHRYRM